MNWERINKEFAQKFTGYLVSINPPCISDNRGYQYIMSAKEVVLGYREDKAVTIDHEKKMIIFNR